MGRHSAPQPPREARTASSRAVVVTVLAVVIAALVVAGAAVLLRGDGTDTASTTAPTSTPTTTAPGSSPGTTSSSPAASPTSSPSQSQATQRPAAPPPTLSYHLYGTSYLTIRVPGGPTLVSRTFHRGDSGAYNYKVLQVVVGNSAAVRFKLNGTPRRPGGRGQVETFTVHRR